MEPSSAHTAAFQDVFRIPEGEIHQYSLPLPDVAGSGKFIVCGDIAIADGNVAAGPADFSWQHFNEKAFVELNFVMSGRLYQTHEGLVRRHLMEQGYSNLLYNPGSWEKNELAGNQGFHNLGVHIRPERMMALLSNYAPELEQLAEKIDKGEPFVMHSPAAYFSPQLEHVLSQIWAVPVSAGLRRLHIETQVLQLFCLQCAVLMADQDLSPGIELRSADRERLHHARQYLLEHLTDPPTFTELAKICGLNEFKLKKGFRIMFRQSVFGFVSNERLNAARQQIIAGDHNISEIAYGLGYAHPQHFNRAFKKKFGITPGALLK